MRIRYFEDTDTALLEFGASAVAETRELSEDVYLDLDSDGGVVGITIEHASKRGDMSEFSFKRLPSKEANQSVEGTGARRVT
ncbi:MAG: DUF2283 domain-containing protein [Verrucomicrobiae bacterium]|nr:DUF2283 domain-containing protein [Verrucomicrobiae bacterium]